jgi:hypothetical protein
MAVTTSRFAPRYPVAVPSGTASGPTVADSLALDGLVLLRIRCRYDRRFKARHEVLGFTVTFGRLTFEPEVQAVLFADAQADFPGIDWRLDHQIWLTTGCIHAAPDAWEDGFIPEDTRTFGGSAPVYVATTPTLAEIGATT